MIHHLPHEALAALLAPIGGVDAPYSARTHAGHNSSMTGIPYGSSREIAYSFWAPEDVARFVEREMTSKVGPLTCSTDAALGAKPTSESSL